MTDAEIVAAEIRAAEVPMSDALGAALDRLERDAERYRAMLDDEIALRRGVRRHARCWPWTTRRPASWCWRCRRMQEIWALQHNAELSGPQRLARW